MSYWWLAIVGIGIVASVAGWYRWRIRSLHRNFVESSISAENLLEKIKRGDAPMIVDLRLKLDALADPRAIPGALPVPPEEVDAKLGQLPRDQEIVLYCTCPNEETSLGVLRQLRAKGFSRVRSLRGGLPEWRTKHYPVEVLDPALERTERLKALLSLDAKGKSA